MSRVPSQNEIYLLHCNKSDEIFSSKFVVGVETSHYFLPWEKVPSDFNKGPESGDYLIPGISWAKFKVVILMFC